LHIHLVNQWPELRCGVHIEFLFTVQQHNERDGLARTRTFIDAAFAGRYRSTMATVTIELPNHAAQTRFNLRRWSEVLEDRELAKIEGRVETDRYGRIIMSPPPAASHGGYQLEIGSLLKQLMPDGRTTTECPISTADGVRAADVAWASPERLRDLGNYECYPKAPEICVEVISPRNSKREIQEKTALYFNAGAKEVWTCSKVGGMTFLGPRGVELKTSKLCPKFPRQLVLAGSS
jgi:Uma2 family endonuclease